MDFLYIDVRSKKRDGTKVIEVKPKFNVKKVKDLMIRGGDFYAVFDESSGLWCTDEDVLIAMVDAEVRRVYKETKDKYLNETVVPLYMMDSDSGSIDRWHKYVQRQCRDNFHPLDDDLCFSNTNLTRESYISKSLKYPLEEGDHTSWDKMVGTLYNDVERHKIEWCIGAIVNGASKYLQKFLVFYGEPGTGKSTIINIIEDLFEGYITTFDAKALGSSNATFALEPFKDNPLVAIQHDGDLSRIEDNTRLNSLVSHEKMTMNAKYEKMYPVAFKTFLIMASNKPVKITDQKSGILRRLIDVTPTGNVLPKREYDRLKKAVKFELGAIAYHCKQVFEEDPGFYDKYTPIHMMEASNDFYNFMLDNSYTFYKYDGTTQKSAWEMYKNWVDDAKVTYPMSLRQFKEELRAYFWDYSERYTTEDGERVRSYYHGFRKDKFEKGTFDEDVMTKPPPEDRFIVPLWLRLKEQDSVFDKECSGCLAQYANKYETPKVSWDKVKTTLEDLDTKKLHYVKIPEWHIVIDFDIPDSDGNKCLEKNIEAASKWPQTYAETSKSGGGLHLHYFYTGDANKLNRIYEDHVEIKVYTGNQTLRRKLTVCNDLPIATISSGLPLREEKVTKPMVDLNEVQSEKGLRTTIKKALAKGIHGDTTSNINAIKWALDNVYNSGKSFDVSDLYGAVLAFAANSTNQAETNIKTVSKMHFKSEEASENHDLAEAPIVFYDVEVFPNLFLVNWKIIEPETESFDDIIKAIHESRTKPVTRMINPSPRDIEKLLQYRLIGFNVRRYDNHMLYACLIGYGNEQIYKLSKNIIDNQKGFFSAAYNISYTDIYDFASAGNKKSLKKLEIEMGVHHQELGLPWDEPVPEELWPRVAEYCDNDVISTEAAFWYLESDWVARQLLADIADLTVNDTTNQLTTKIIFGNEKKPQSQFCYRNLAEPVKELPIGVSEFLHDACPEMMAWWSANSDSLLPYFPGYKYEWGKSTYLGQEVGEGGRVYAEPGIHFWDALLDVSSMHPHSTIAECLFGPEFTRRFKEIVDGRVSIKHEAWSEINNILGGKLTKYIKWVEDGKITSKQLSNALKTAINSVYGLTAAKFDNPFKDPRNVDNIVAKRGALFMMNLEQEVKKLGYTVAHIKTDSIKIPMADKKIIDFVMDFGKRYGYTFEHEATYERMCLVNDAVYIARYAKAEDCDKLYGYVPDDNKKKGGQWTATGTQFAVPYVFKSLFTHEDITFDDMCETMSVTSALYLRNSEDPDNPEFIGRVGQFCPIKPGCGGMELLREGKDKEGNRKFSAATGSKGYLWLESEQVKSLHKENDIDRSYYDTMANKAIETISQFGDFDAFVDVDTVPQYEHYVMDPTNCDPDFRQCPIYKERMGTPDPDFPDCKSDYCWNCQYRHVPETDPWQEPDICERGYDIHDLIPF
jgi:hypothetical protein